MRWRSGRRADAAEADPVSQEASLPSDNSLSSAEGQGDHVELRVLSAEVEGRQGRQVEDFGAKLSSEQVFHPPSRSEIDAEKGILQRRKRWAANSSSGVPPSSVPSGGKVPIEGDRAFVRSSSSDAAEPPREAEPEEDDKAPVGRDMYWPVSVEKALGTVDSDGKDEVSLTDLGVGTSRRARVTKDKGRDSGRDAAGRPAKPNPIEKRLDEKRRAAAKQADPQPPPVPSTGVAASSTSAQARNQRRARRRAEARGADIPDSELGCVVLIREDTRLHDNPALHAAIETFKWVVPVYVHDDSDPSPWPVRGAGLWWRHESLNYYDGSLRKLGSRIIYRRGIYEEQVVDVLLETGASALYFNRQLEPWHVLRDGDLQDTVEQSLGLKVESFKGMVMAFEPWETKQKGTGREKAKDKDTEWRLPDPVPTITSWIGPPPQGWPFSLDLADLGYGLTGGRKIPRGNRQYNEVRQELLQHGVADPKVDDWAYEMRKFWKMGEHAAMERVEEFIKEAAWGCYFPPELHPQDKAGGRFRADKKWTAIISPYIRFGDLSPRYIYARCRQTLPYELRRLFTKRVIWRDKAYAQLYRWPDSHATSIRSQYENQVWSGTRLALRRWQRGETGYPLVDAAMRQLWKVGWMCNHLRHVTAQFLIEHMDLNWKDGFDWYDYTLVDTDVAINAMMWQMGGHSGIGSWNFVMHPVFAGKKVDPEGNYVRRWMPELAHLPVEYIHCPWDAPMGTRISANVLINGVYWQRVIEDLIAARKIHQKNVITLRKQFPEFMDKDGSELLPLGPGRMLKLEVRDDIRENDENKITLMMTADDARSVTRRNLKAAKGVHTGLIYDETKRFEAMYDIDV